MKRAPFLLLLLTTLPAAAQPADLVLKDGVVHTLDPQRPRAKAVAIRGERILAVDPAWVGEDTRVINLDGACVVPGLWDAHAHLLGLGLARQRLNVTGTESFAEVVGHVRDGVMSSTNKSLVVGQDLSRATVVANLETGALHRLTGRVALGIGALFLLSALTALALRQSRAAEREAVA